MGALSSLPEFVMQMKKMGAEEKNLKSQSKHPHPLGTQGARLCPPPQDEGAGLLLAGIPALATRVDGSILSTC